MKATDIKKKKERQLSPLEDANILFEWQIQKKLQVNIYLQFGVVIFLLIVVGFLFWQKNYFGSFTILIIILLIFLLKKEGGEINCAILNHGIRLKNEFFPWKNLESFWIFEDNIPEIYLKTKKAFVQNIPIPIKIKDAKKIKSILIKFLPEKKTQRSLSDIILRTLGM